jgi:hypothetical protein
MFSSVVDETRLCSLRDGNMTLNVGRNLKGVLGSTYQTVGSCVRIPLGHGCMLMFLCLCCSVYVEVVPSSTCSEVKSELGQVCKSWMVILNDYIRTMFAPYRAAWCSSVPCARIVYMPRSNLDRGTGCPDRVFADFSSPTKKLLGWFLE